VRKPRHLGSSASAPRRRPSSPDVRSAAAASPRACPRITIACCRASKPRLIPAGSLANTEAIGSPAGTLSPWITVMTNPTVGPRHPPPRDARRPRDDGRPDDLRLHALDHARRGALYTSTSCACGSTDRILDDLGVPALGLDHPLELLGGEPRSERVLEAVARLLRGLLHAGGEQISTPRA